MLVAGKSSKVELMLEPLDYGLYIVTSCLEVHKDSNNGGDDGQRLSMASTMSAEFKRINHITQN